MNDIFVSAGTDVHFSTWDIFLPLGISFFTFQSMSYTFDVMEGRFKVVRSLRDFALYVIFWPQLVAGPIMRIHELLPQFNILKKIDVSEFKYGIRRIIEGLFLKLVIADNIAPFVNEGFRTYEYNSILDNWSLAFAFGLQIYLDFAGYTSIAIGSAKLLGISLTENFNFPYTAANPRLFWKNWHISLSSWVRDYLYIPFMGQSRRSSSSTGGIQVAADVGLEVTISEKRRSFSLFASWAIMGLWHGANWTFVLWGLWHAMIIQVYRWISVFTKKNTSISTKWYVKSAGYLVTLMAVMMGWVFFRAENLNQAVHMLVKMFDISTIARISYRENNYLLLVLFYTGFFVYYFIYKNFKGIQARFLYDKLGWVYNSVIYASLTISIIAFFDKTQPFIYFQF
ncbi:MAG: MBOAT family O-acyltransferase [Candidatus Scalindua sp.]